MDLCKYKLWIYYRAVIGVEERRLVPEIKEEDEDPRG